MKDIVSTNTMQKSWLLLFLVWILATIGALASLFFSEIMKLPVCSLCWYQRIAMYPLVVILPIALFPFDAKVTRYAGVLVLFGWLTALFHVLLVAGYIPKSAQPCVQGIPCSETHINILGLINMPIMSLFTFSVMGLLLFLVKKSESL
jgi:disulfide bond formation protein DsbB|tara:strand:+ start:650 stop:1093 length:444 start_codon:yes stop_codon:yes gene_type:complete